MSRNLQFLLTVDSSNAIVGLRQFQGALQEVGPVSTKAADESTAAFNRIEKILGKMQSAVIGYISAFVFRKVVQGFKDILQAGIDFDSSFTNVRKTVQGSAADFESLSAQFRQMAKEIPLGVTEINRIAEAAGQVGVHVEDLRDFTQLMAEVTATTRVSAEEATVSFARLANILEIPIANIKTLASVITDLDRRNAASTEEILAFSMNIAAAGHRVGMTAEEIAALATTLAATGLGAEKAGSAISRVFIEMEKAVSMPGEKLKLYDQIVPHFAELFKTNAAEALLKFTDRLDRASKSGQDIIPILESLGLRNIRLEDVVGRLTIAHEKYAAALAQAREEATKGGEALDKRYRTELEKVQAQLQLIKNELNDVAIDLSNKMLPSIVAAGNALVVLAHNLDLVATAIGLVTLGIVSMKLAPWIAEITASAAALKVLDAVMIGIRNIAVEGLSLGFLKVAASTVAVIGGLTAIGVALVAVTKYWAEYNDAVANGLQDENKRWNAVQMAINALKEHGIVVDKNGKSLEQLEKEIANVGRGLQKDLIKEQKEAAEWFKEATKRADEFQGKIVVLTDAQKKYAEMVKAVKDRVLESSQKDQALIDGLVQLRIAGVSTTAILDEFGSTIADLIERQVELGNLKNLPQILAFYGYAIQDQIDLNDKIKGTSNTLSGYNDRLDDTRKLYNEAAAAAEKFIGQSQLNRSKQSTGILSNIGQLPTELYGGEIAGIEEHSMLSEEEITKRKIAAKKAEEDLVKYWDSKMNMATDSIFRAFAEKGKISMRDLGSFLAKVFDPITDAILAPLRKNVTTLFSKLLSGEDGKSGLVGGLNHAISGISDSVAKVFTGSKGGILSQAIGGAMSAGITAAIGIGISAIASLIKKSGSEVNNKLVKDIQNPFTEAVTNLIKSFDELRASGKLTLESAIDTRAKLTGLYTKFKDDTAAYASQGEKNATAVGNAFKTLAQYWGTDGSALFGKIDAAIEELGGTAGMTAEGLTELNKSIEVLNEFTKAVQGFVDSVAKPTENVDALEASLKQMYASGVPTQRILDILGDSIRKAYQDMAALGLEIPGYIAFYKRLTDAEGAAAAEAETLAKLIEDYQGTLTSVNTQLSETVQTLASTLLQDLNTLTSEIEQSQNKIDGWQKQIDGLNTEIVATSAKLNDATYWQQRYSETIKDAEDSYKAAVDKRQSLEKQIADLEVQVERDRLNDMVKNSKNESILKAARLALDRLDHKQEEDRITQLAALRTQLVDAIAAEREATDVLALKKVLAEQSIAAEKQQMAAELESKTSERNALLLMIDAEKQRVDSLTAEKAYIEQVIREEGVARQDELDAMNASIDALRQRKQWLIQESAVMQQLIQTTQNQLASLPTNTTLTSGVQPQANAAQLASAQQILASMPAPEPNYIDPAAAAYLNQMYAMNGYGSSTVQSGVIPQLGTGMDFVPHRMLAMLDPGEKVIAARDTPSPSQQGTSLSIKIGALNVQVSGGGGADAGKEAAYSFVRTLETDAVLRQRITRALPAKR